MPYTRLSTPQTIIIKITAYFLLCVLAIQSAAIADPTVPLAGQAGISNGQDLDLGSTQRNLSSGLPSDGSVTIQSGQTSRQIGAADLVTAAELMAMQQILATGNQSLLLSDAGQALGGSVFLNNQTLNNLVIPSGVTVLHDFGTANTLDLAGTLNNAGNFYAFSSNALTNNALISASQIINQQGALVSSVLPSSLSMLAASNLSLTLSAVNNLINAGTITSANNLTLTAGGNIVNALPQMAMGSTPVMQALGSLNMQAPNIINSGLITSSAAHINIAGQATSALLINNSGGRIESLLGTINIRDALFNSKVNLDILGGNLLSQELNLFGGQGTINVDVGQLTGLVNLTAGQAYVQTSTDNLLFGQVQISGDPVFINTGNLVLPSATASQPYIAVAGGNITVTPGFVLDTTSTTADGGSVFLIAGASATLSNGLVIITGRSTTGGDVDLTGISGFDTFSTLSTASGGDVTLLAFSLAAGSSQGGHVIVPTGITIRTGIAGSGGAGNLLAVAEASGVLGSPNSISLGNFDGTSASAGSSRINILTISPDITALKPLVIVAATAEKASGAIADGPLQSGGVATGALTAPGGLVKILAGGAISTAPINANSASSGGQVILLSGGTPTPLPVGVNTGAINSTGATTPTGTVTITSPGSISTGNITTGGASVLLLGGESSQAGDIAFGDIDTSGASGGSVQIVSLGSSGSIGSAGSNIITGANSSTGISGAVTISSANGVIALSGVSTKATSLTGTAQAGSVFLSSGNLPLAPSTNTITLSAATTIDTSTASGTGTAGQIYITYNGANSGTNVTVGNSIQDQGLGSRLATPALARQDQYSLLGSQTIALTPGTGGGAATILGFSAGGFASVDDSGGGIVLTVNTGGDASAIVPLSVANGAFALTNAASQIVSTVNTGTPSNMSLLAQGGINLSLQLSTTSGAFPVTFMSSATGDITINNTAVNQSLNFGPATSTGNISLSNNGNLSFNEMLVSGLNLTITTTGSNGDITFPANVIGFNLTATANGSGKITGTDSLVTVGDAILASTSGDIDTLNLNVNRFSANTTGNVDLKGQRSLVSLTSTGNNFKIEVHNRNGSLTVAGAGITATNNLTLETKKNGDIILTANITGVQIELSANGSGAISQVAATSISGTSLVLNSGSGAIGTNSNPITGSTATVSANSSGNVFLLSSGATVSLGSSSGANFSLQAPVGKIDVISDITATALLSLSALNGINAVESVIQTIPVGLNPAGVAVATNGGFAYVANTGSDNISVINTATNTVVNTIPVGASPTGVAVSPNGLLVYVTNSANDSVSQISTVSGTVIKTITVPGTPTGVSFNGSGSQAYVTSASLDTVTIIDTATGDISGAPINVQASPGAVAFNNSNSLLYVGNQAANSISVIDPISRTVNNVPIAFSPVAFGPCPCGTKIFVADGVNGVHAFSTESNSVVVSIVLPVGSAPSGIGINPTGSLAYIANAGNGTVSTITTLTNTVSSTTTVGGSPQAFGGFASFVDSHPAAYVSNTTLHLVSYIRTPLATAPQYSFSSGTGAVNLSINNGLVQASNTTGSVIITSANSIVSLGGNADTFQLATPLNITVNAPITARVIDLHAMNGIFTNNSTITATGALFFIASPNIRNFGIMTMNNAGGTAGLNLQAPSGLLNVELFSGSQLTVFAPGNTSSLLFNPAGGTRVIVNAQPGTLISADIIRILGNRENYTIDFRVNQISGVIDIPDRPTVASIQNSQGPLTLGTLTLTQSVTGSNFFAYSPGTLTIGNIDASYSGPGQNITDLRLASDTNIILNGSILANGISGGSIRLYANSLTITGGGLLSANGTAGTGGLIGIGNGRPLIVLNDGTIIASNTADNSGIVGFNSNPYISVIVTGSGTIHGGALVSFGYLNLVTLLPIDPIYLLPTDSFSLYGISMQQGAAVGNLIALGLSAPSITSQEIQSTSTVNTAFIQPQTPPNALIDTDKIRFTVDFPRSALTGKVVHNQEQSLIAALPVSSIDALPETSGQATFYSDSARILNLSQGRLLITAQEDMTINTPLASVFIKTGAVVLVNVLDGNLAVYDLHDKNSGHVIIAAGNQTTTLWPGTVAYLSKDKSIPLKQLDSENFPLRNIVESRSETGESSLTLYKAEFSLLAALTKVDILAKAFSSNLSVDKKLVSSLRKGAAALHTLHQGHGAYKAP